MSEQKEKLIQAIDMFYHEDQSATEWQMLDSMLKPYGLKVMKKHTWTLADTSITISAVAIIILLADAVLIPLFKGLLGIWIN